MSTEEEITLQDLADLAIMRGKVYGFLSGIYTQLPGPDFVQRLKDSGMINLLDTLTAGDLAGDIAEGLRLVKGYLVTSQDTPPDGVQTDLGVDRTRLLRGIKPGYGPPPPYESVYAGTEQAPLMEASASVVQAYADAGVGLAEGVHDQPDFIGFELDFMRHLTEKEARAWVSEDRGEVIRVLENERAFLEQHIVAWIPRFCDVMLEEARTDFFRGIARLTKGYVLDEASKTKELLEEARNEPAE
jgi:TorA maturation chaperone TorD